MRKKEKFDPVVEKAYLKDVVDWLKDLKVLVKEGKDVEEINKNFINIGDFILHCGQSKINLFREGMDGIEKEESEKMSHRKNNIKCVISDIVIGKIVKMISGEMNGKSSPSEKMRSKNCFTKSNLKQCLRRNKSVENFVLKHQIKNFIDEIIETMIEDGLITKLKKDIYTDYRLGEVYKVNPDTLLSKLINLSKKYPSTKDKIIWLCKKRQKN